MTAPCGRRPTRRSASPCWHRWRWWRRAVRGRVGRPGRWGLPAFPLLSYQVFGLALFGLATVIGLGYCWRRPGIRGALIASAYLAFAFYMLPTSTHERYLYPFVALLLPVALLDRRWL